AGRVLPARTVGVATDPLADDIEPPEDPGQGAGGALGPERSERGQADLVDESDELLGARCVTTGVDDERSALVRGLDDLCRVRGHSPIGLHGVRSEVDRSTRYGASAVRHGIQYITDPGSTPRLPTRAV